MELFPRVFWGVRKCKAWLHLSTNSNRVHGQLFGPSIIVAFIFPPLVLVSNEMLSVRWKNVLESEHTGLWNNKYVCVLWKKEWKKERKDWVVEGIHGPQHNKLCRVGIIQLTRKACLYEKKSAVLKTKKGCHTFTFSNKFQQIPKKSVFLVSYGNLFIGSGWAKREAYYFGRN